MLKLIEQCLQKERSRKYHEVKDTDPLNGEKGEQIKRILAMKADK